jgi:hypothetical protein
MYNTQFIGTEMYFDTQLEHDYEVMKDMIEKEMHKTKEQALTNLSRVVHFEIESFSRVLSYSYIEENEDAIKLACKLNLGKLEFLAILEDVDGFKEEYLRDIELAQNF